MAYYDFVSNAGSGMPTAKRIARSTNAYVVGTANPLTVGDADSDYVSVSSNVITFKQNCRILLHYEVTSSPPSDWVKMELYKNNVIIGTTITASVGQYKCGFYVLDVAKDDTLYGKAWPYDSSGGSVPHYTVYVLTEE